MEHDQGQETWYDPKVAVVFQHETFQLQLVPGYKIINLEQRLEYQQQTLLG